MLYGPNERGALVSVAGSERDTVSALGMAGTVDQMTYVSSAGGAFLERMEGKELPSVRALARSCYKPTSSVSLTGVRLRNSR